ncbi:hypothetical protein AYO44_02505 [Planctomycetaceae bacterium SCGC AG-212-F19]|nr:hypothetical protein AYO44_02505 [Planctomycetaceae bacterium SCGC AG-212-F19]
MAKVKPVLGKIRTALKAAKTELGKDEPAAKLIEGDLDEGLTAIEEFLKAYKEKKAKIRAPLIKARATLNTCVGIIKDGESIVIIDLLDKALKATSDADRLIKAD